MSNIIDLAAVRAELQHRQNLSRLDNLLSAGLSRHDLTLLSLACNRAFSGRVIPTPKEAGQMGFERLHHLFVAKETVDDVDCFVIGTKGNPVISYVISHSTLTFEWHEEGAQSINLSTIKDPGRVVVNELLNRMEEKGYDCYSLYGQFALDVFYFACNSCFNPLHLQYFPEPHRAGLILYDPLRKVDVVLIADMHRWLPTPEDLAVPASE